MSAAKQPKRVGAQRIGHYYRDDASISKKLPAPDFSRWCTIYPAYLDSSRTWKQGRRVNKARGIDGPNVLEIFEACKMLKVPCVTELGSYPRSWWDQEPAHAEPGKGLGRVRFMLLGDDGERSRVTPDDLEPRVDEGIPIKNRAQMLKLICKLLPEIRDRMKLHLRPDPNIALLGQQTTKTNKLVDDAKGQTTKGGSAKKKKKKKKKKR
eukprot:g4469.t1